MTDKPQKDLYETSEFYLLIALIVIYCIYSLTNNFLILGLDYSYYLLVRILPFFTGLLIVGLIKFQRLKNIYTTDKTKRSKKALIGLYIFLSVVFSFFTFNLVASIIWTEKMKIVAESKPIEYYECKIVKLNHSRTGNSVSFIFKEKKEYVHISLEEYRDFKDKNIKGLYMEIEARKGFDNYYIVESRKIKVDNRISGSYL
jgi:hypothetical protein